MSNDPDQPEDHGAEELRRTGKGRPQDAQVIHAAFRA